MIDNFLKKFNINKKVALVVFIIIAALFIFFTSDKPAEAPATAETSQTQTVQTEQTAADEGETEESGLNIHIGWSNIAIFGGLIVALGVVTYKKKLKTDKKNLKETK
jgi:Na+/H+ antiporter NhaC